MSTCVFTGRGSLTWCMTAFVVRLHEPYFNVTYTIKNTGSTYGAEVCLPLFLPFMHHLMSNIGYTSVPRSLNCISTFPLLLSRPPRCFAALHARSSSPVNPRWRALHFHDMICPSGTSLNKDGRSRREQLVLQSERAVETSN